MRLGSTHTPETRQRMSEAMRGKILSPETRARISEVQRGKTLSPEHRAKISATLRGRTPSETRATRSAAATIHGHSGTPEYKAWLDMRGRCSLPSHRDFARYGGRDITVCDEWRASFVAFYQHIGARPGPEYSLDRIDNDGPYEPGNVRWATAKEQARNRRPQRPRRQHPPTGIAS